MKSVPVVIMIMIMISVVIVMVPPIPVTSLVFSREMAVVAMGIAVDFDHPLVVITSFIVIPTVTVVIIRIVGIIMIGAAGGRKRQHESSAYQE